MLSRVTISTPTDREIVIVRDFGAPREMVWDSMTSPALLRRWLSGPPGWSMGACEGELRAGGPFRWTWRGPSGEEMVMHGVNLEVVLYERIVRTESFEHCCDSQPDVNVGTLVLEDLKGDGGGGSMQKTRLRLSLLYPSKAARDRALESGATAGMAAGYDRLDVLLVAMLESGEARGAA